MVRVPVDAGSLLLMEFTPFLTRLATCYSIRIVEFRWRNVGSGKILGTL